MIIPLDKLISISENKYIFTKAAMEVVNKVDYIDEIPDDLKWKIVPNIMKVMIDGTLKYELQPPDID
ncbi:MAG: hypothetical protein JW982_09715 [Spirochaetes bacterium]|nr:hypothetical protein [Spirochaetota bacterium]